jgi:hypothetical protein
MPVLIVGFHMLAATPLLSLLSGFIVKNQRPGLVPLPEHSFCGVTLVAAPSWSLSYQRNIETMRVPQGTPSSYSPMARS